jgi:hypothetical protein
VSPNAARYTSFPRTEPPQPFVEQVVGVFRQHEEQIGTVGLKKGLTSDEALAVLRPGLVALGFGVEAGKRAEDKIERPVFFGENGAPTLRYEIDAYHPGWRCGLEVEAGRAWMGGAVYRDLIQALVMVEVDTLMLAVPNTYKFKSDGRLIESRDYEKTVSVADALFGHSRMRLPYRLVVIGY